MRSIRFLLFLYLPISVMAQRGHEIQVRYGNLFNRQDIFYQYFEPNVNTRHTFEIEQTFTAEYYGLSWFYPFNPYIKTGFSFFKSINAELKLFEQESTALNTVTGKPLRPDTLYMGLNIFDADYMNFGLSTRVNLVWVKNLNAYILLEFNHVRFENIDEADNTIEMENPQFRSAVFKDIIRKQIMWGVTYGGGITYRLRKGFNLLLIEISALNVFGEAINLAAANTLKIQTGISYSFIRRR